MEERIGIFFNMTENKSKIEKHQEPIEIDFIIIADKPSVKEKLIKEDIWNMCLEGWLDKKGKKKAHSWVVEKKEFDLKRIILLDKSCI